MYNITYYLTDGRSVNFDPEYHKKTETDRAIVLEADGRKEIIWKAHITGTVELSDVN